MYQKIIVVIIALVILITGYLAFTKTVVSPDVVSVDEIDSAATSPVSSTENNETKTTDSSTSSALIDKDVLGVWEPVESTEVLSIQNTFSLNQNGEKVFFSSSVYNPETGDRSIDSDGTWEISGNIFFVHIDGVATVRAKIDKVTQELVYMDEGTEVRWKKVK